MALASIPIPPDQKRDAKARDLAKTAHTWNVVTLKQDWGAFPKGSQALQTPNGYRVNAVWCECPDYAEWGNICKHIRCIVFLDAQRTTPLPKRYEDVVPTCQEPGCDNDPEPRERYCWKHWLVDAF